MRKRFTVTISFVPRNKERETQFLRLVHKLFEFLAGLPEATYNLRVEEGRESSTLDD